MVAIFVGGPLDGQDVIKTNGRWCLYRTEAGDSCKRIPATLDNLYVYQEHRGKYFYIHASVIDSCWRERYHK